MMKKTQQGFSLFIVMILMLVIAFLVVITSQSSLTEMRMSSNESDRKFALSLAEKGLRSGEFKIQDIFKNKTAQSFTAACTKGFCLPSQEGKAAASTPFSFQTGAAAADYQYPAWERCQDSPAQNPTTCVGKTVLDEGCAGKTCIQPIGNEEVYYVIEYLGFRENDGVDTFRITSRARGNNSDTAVTLQSYVELTR